MAAPAPQQFDTIREAFCAVYKCRPEAFEKKVFWRGLYRHAWLPAHWMWWFERDFFGADLSSIHAMGEARSEPELHRAIDDLENLKLVERSIRRGTLVIRVSGTRVINVLQPLVPLLKPLPSHTEFITTAEPGTRLPTDAPVDSAPRSDGVAMTVRRLKRLHTDVAAGRDWNLALTDSGLDPQRLEALLAENSAGRPELAWLRRYVADQRELERLRVENEGLRKAVEALKAGR